MSFAGSAAVRRCHDDLFDAQCQRSLQADLEGGVRVVFAASIEE
jgi:hypothetical protein